MPRQIHVKRKTPDALVLPVYERLFVGQPQIRVEGLCAIGEHYYLVCPDIGPEPKASDGSPLREWLFEPLPTLFPPVDLVEQAPPGARKVAVRPVRAVVELRGVSRIMREVFADLALSLGPEFPPFSLLNPEGALEIHVERELDAKQLTTLQTAADALDLPMEITIVFSSRPPDGMTFYRGAGADGMLLPSRALSADVPRKVRWLIEEDEEFWMSNRDDALLGGVSSSAMSMFPGSWRGAELRCVVDATVALPTNIRSYLTLFDTVFLALPLEDKFDAALRRLGTTAEELVELLGTGRLRILLPHTVERYAIPWLAAALERSPESVVASRRLACGVLADTRLRMPFLHPALDFQDRRLLMAALDSASESPEMAADVRRWFRTIANVCREAWQFAPLCIHRDGALQTSRSGIGWLASRLRQEFTGEERIVEIMGASPGVEWAAALNAHVFPTVTEKYSDAAACHLLAALSSPMQMRQVPVADPRMHGIVDGLLAIENDIPLVEFANTFRGGDVQRFRRLVGDIAIWNQEPSYLQSEIDRFNAEVRQCESKPNRLRTLNIAGFVAAVASEAAPVLPPGLPLGVWLLGVLVGVAAEPTPKNTVVGRLWDYSTALLGQTTPRAVLVSRLRQQLGVLSR